MLVTQLHTEKTGPSPSAFLFFPLFSPHRGADAPRRSDREPQRTWRPSGTAVFSCAPPRRSPVDVRVSGSPFCGLRSAVCCRFRIVAAKIRNLSIFATGLSECTIRRPEKLTKGNLLCLVGFVFFSARLLFVSFEPLFAGQLLHVGHQVLFVGDFLAEQGFEDILEGDDTLEAAVFVEDDADLFLA